MIKKYFASVVEVISEYTVVINKGRNDGINENSLFLIIEVGNEIIDPDTGESLGALEITKGWCSPKHIQEKICTIESNTYERDEGSTEVKKTRNSLIMAIGGETVTEVSKPGRKYLLELENVTVGDKVIAKGIQQQN